MERPSRNQVANPRGTASQDTPSSANVASQAYLAQAMIKSAAATTSHAVEKIMGNPPVTEGYQIQQFFGAIRQP